MSISENPHLFSPMAVGMDMVLCPFSFTTDASGDVGTGAGLTTGTSFPGLSIARTSTLVYTATMPDYGLCPCVLERHDSQHTIGCDTEVSASSGTVTLTFSAVFASKRCDVVVFALETTSQGV